MHGWMNFHGFWKPSPPVQAFVPVWCWGLKGLVQERDGVGLGQQH